MTVSFRLVWLHNKHWGEGMVRLSYYLFFSSVIFFQIFIWTFYLTDNLMFTCITVMGASSYKDFFKNNLFL